MTAAADALGVGRLLVALVFPMALARAMAAPSRLPLGLFAVAAASDFIDGILARRAARPSRHGAILDVTADVAFVLAATGTAARLRLVSWVVPCAIALAAVAYAVASAQRSRRGGPFELAHSRVGHAAGVLNYALAGLLAAAPALPDPSWPPILRLAGHAVAAVNLAAIVVRLVPTRSRGVPPARPNSGGKIVRGASQEEEPDDRIHQHER